MSGKCSCSSRRSPLSCPIHFLEASFRPASLARCKAFFLAAEHALITAPRASRSSAASAALRATRLIACRANTLVWEVNQMLISVPTLSMHKFERKPCCMQAWWPAKQHHNGKGCSLSVPRNAPPRAVGDQTDAVSWPSSLAYPPPARTTFEAHRRGGEYVTKPAYAASRRRELFQYPLIAFPSSKLIAFPSSKQDTPACHVRPALTLR